MHVAPICLLTSLAAAAASTAALGPPSPQDSAATDSAQDVAAPTWLSFPDEPLGRPWASVSAGQEPWDYLARPESEAPDAAGEPWATWAADLGTVGAGRDTPGRRQAIARLCRFAARDGRPEDAYRWAATLGADDPAALAGVVPYLFPGLPFGTPLGASGQPGPIAPSTILRPLLPPSSERLPFGQVQWREALATGMQVGRVGFDLQVKVDGSGVVAEFREIQGERGSVEIVMPSPAGFRLKSMYVDWDKVPLPEGADADTFNWSEHPVRVTLDPEAGNYSVFARMGPLESELPSPPGAGAGLATSLRESGIWIQASRDTQPDLEEIASAWGDAVGISARVVRDESAADPGGGIRGAVIDLRRSSAPERLIRTVTSAIEGWALPRTQAKKEPGAKR